MNRRAVGTKYEAAAAAYLEKEGYQFIEKNFYGRHGEIDLIAKDGCCLVFIEVKYRKNQGSGMPWEAVDRRKQQRLIVTAKEYVAVRNLPLEISYRFDVVSILGDSITLYKNAFGII